MNLNNLNALIDRLANLDGAGVQFDMEWTAADRRGTRHPCGSACCIGGHAALMMGATESDEPDDDLMTFLGIPFEDARAIAYPRDCPDVWAATAAQAVRLLEIYRDTGKVDWAQAMGEAE